MLKFKIEKVYIVYSHSTKNNERCYRFMRREFYCKQAGYIITSELERISGWIVK